MNYSYDVLQEEDSWNNYKKCYIVVIDSGKSIQRIGISWELKYCLKEFKNFGYKIKRITKIC